MEQLQLPLSGKESEKVSFEWHIENVSASTNFENSQSEILSPIFRFNRLGFRLKFIELGSYKTSLWFPKITLTLEKPKLSGGEKLIISQNTVCSYFFMNDTAAHKSESNCVHELNENNYEICLINIKEQSPIAKDLKNDQINVCCNLTVYHIHALECNCPLHPDNMLYSLQHAQEKLFEEVSFPDVKFVVEEKEVPAHKGILANRSSVMSAMLTHDMLEKKESRIFIADCTYDIFKQFLKYLYCGKLDNFNENVCHLIALADKYDVQDLKSMCEVELCRQLNSENLVEFLHLASYHKVEKLKNKIIESLNGDEEKARILVLAYEKLLK